MPRLSVLHLSIFLIYILSSTVDSYNLYYGVECYSWGSPENVTFVAFVVYNKGKFLTYNSTENKVIAYSEIGSKWAKDFNNQTEWLRMEAERISTYCKDVAIKLSVVDKTVKPKVTVRSVTPAHGDQPAVLMCSAYDYYPKNITLTWLRDGEKVTDGVTSTEELPDGDWYYQIHSQLEYNPKHTENISCMVEHLSFSKPELFFWRKESLSESDRDKIVIGVTALLLGGVIAATGLLYYKSKQTGWTSVSIELSS